MMTSNLKNTLGDESTFDNAIQSLQEIIGTDAGGRGMKRLIVPGDLLKASQTLASLSPESQVLILSGFPCCVNEVPPTETDGPPGALALAQAAVHLGCQVRLLTDDCNRDVFLAAMEDVPWQQEYKQRLMLETFSSQLSSQDESKLKALARSCDLIMACERAGPAGDGNCYTMRGTNMTERGLIAPLHRIVTEKKPSCSFLAIGDGGNELGMGKVHSQIVEHIPQGDRIGCVVPADCLVAASVSNWGGYALAAGAALAKARQSCANSNNSSAMAKSIKSWVEKCVPTEEAEIALLQRCVAAGCRDGVSGKVEATVDGMPLERSLQCLRDIREAALSACD